MEFKGVEICCPVCRGELSWDDGDQAFRCGGCQRNYPLICGIPDFRIFDDPYITAEDDRAKGVRIAQELDGKCFNELIDFYYSITDVVPPEHARQYKQGLLSAEARAKAALQGWWSDRAEESESPRTLLEIGCGTGPLLVAATGNYERMVGVDIAFRWLVMARKRLEEAGIDPPLICACAEALPFPDATFDRVVGDSVIELVADQDAVMAEARRVMKPRGAAYLATPNRFSVGPDPHTGLLAGGMLPERLVAAYMERKQAKPPIRKLLSARALASLLERSGFANHRIFLADFPDEQRRHFGRAINLGVSAYHLAKRAPVGRSLMRLIGPRLHATGRME